MIVLAMGSSFFSAATAGALFAVIDFVQPEPTDYAIGVERKRFAELAGAAVASSRFPRRDSRDGPANKTSRNCDSGCGVGVYHSRRRKRKTVNLRRGE